MYRMRDRHCLDRGVKYTYRETFVQSSGVILRAGPWVDVLSLFTELKFSKLPYQSSYSNCFEVFHAMLPHFALLKTQTAFVYLYEEQPKKYDFPSRNEIHTHALPTVVNNGNYLTFSTFYILIKYMYTKPFMIMILSWHGNVFRITVQGTPRPSAVLSYKMTIPQSFDIFFVVSLNAVRKKMGCQWLKTSGRSGVVTTMFLICKKN